MIWIVLKGIVIKSNAENGLLSHPPNLGPIPRGFFLKIAFARKIALINELGQNSKKETKLSKIEK
jgi:hypothetical protein